MPGRIDFSMGFNTLNTARKRESHAGFRIYLLGNFSGRTETVWQERKIRRIDCDNFDDAMARIAPTFETDSSLKLQFNSMDDFHPDAWLDEVPILADLLKLKKDLADPDSAAQAAAKIQAFYHAETPQEVPDQAEAITESKDQMLERLLGGASEKMNPRPDSVDKLIDRVISPFVKAEAEPQHQFLQGVIDTMIGQFLRTLLHHPEFQQLEALWRATEALVNEEAGDEQQFFLVDIGKDELLDDLNTGAPEFARILLQHAQTDEEQKEILLLDDYCFSAGEEDLALLAYFSKLANACGGRFLGGAGTSLLEQALSDDAAPRRQWRHYLDTIAADCALLSYPRYLQRLPYGKKRNPVETLEFEECSPLPQTDELLWASPTFLCARALVRSQQNVVEEPLFFGDIAVFSYQRDGEPVLQPATETLLNEAQANTLLSRGFIPLIGFRQRQGVRLVALSSLAESG